MPETQQIQTSQASAASILSIFDGAPRVSLLPAGFEPALFLGLNLRQIVKIAHPFGQRYANLTILTALAG